LRQRSLHRTYMVTPLHTHCYAELFVLHRRVCMSTEFLSLAFKHWIVHSCGALCTTAVHNFHCYASGAAGLSPSYMAISRWCFLSVVVLWCRLVLRPVPVVMWHCRVYISRDVFAKCHSCCYEPRVTGVFSGGLRVSLRWQIPTHCTIFSGTMYYLRWPLRYRGVSRLLWSPKLP
jgi:hypothetical protein